MNTPCSRITGKDTRPNEALHPGRCRRRLPQPDRIPSSCPSARVCYTAQGDARCKCHAWGPYGTVFSTRDGGKHWKQVYRAHGRSFPIGTITCPSVSICYAVGPKQRNVPAGQILLSTNDGGRTWTMHRLPATPFLACPGAMVCYAADHAAAVFRTTDGGATWQPLP